MSYIDELIPSVTVPEGEKGEWRIERRSINPDKLSQVISSISSGRSVPPGEYTFLYRGKVLVMSDTPDEKNDHKEAVRKAKGNCLIAGLGIGMVLNAVLLKSEVEHVTVVEYSQDVIDLVSNHYNKLYPGRITFIQADIYDWKPEPGARFDMAWYDIWDDLCLDNLPLMTKLHRKFGQKVSWQGSWGKDWLLDYCRRSGW